MDSPSTPPPVILPFILINRSPQYYNSIWMLGEKKREQFLHLSISEPSSLEVTTQLAVCEQQYYVCNLWMVFLQQEPVLYDKREQAPWTEGDC